MLWVRLAPLLNPLDPLALGYALSLLANIFNMCWVNAMSPLKMGATGSEAENSFNTEVDLLLIFLIFTGSCKTLKTPLFMLFVASFFSTNLTPRDVVLHFVLVSNHRKL